MSTPSPFMSVKARLLALLASAAITAMLLGAVVVGMTQPDGSVYAQHMIAGGTDAPAAALPAHSRG
jgi:hypothetical protein